MTTKSPKSARLVLELSHISLRSLWLYLFRLNGEVITREFD
jgi:hypothetical protein